MSILDAPESFGRPECRLAVDEIDFWTAPLELAPDILRGLAATLSEPERERAQRFFFETHRNRFVAGRGLLRVILARYLSARPGQVQFEYGPAGKPALAGEFAECGIEFNLSHCEELAVLAVTRRTRIGADVERIWMPAEADELVNRFFSRREAALFARLQASDKPLAFFNLWTRKEAFLKATGQGIGHCLGRVEVAFLPNEAPRLLQLPAEVAGGNAGQWALHVVEPASGYVAAIACEGTPKRVISYAPEACLQFLKGQ